ncbi:MAG: hypothetical protein ABH883_08085, partial [Candidatus Omnitrophota bacterium]
NGVVSIHIFSDVSGPGAENEMERIKHRGDYAEQILPTVENHFNALFVSKDLERPGMLMLSPAGHIYHVAKRNGKYLYQKRIDTEGECPGLSNAACIYNYGNSIVFFRHHYNFDCDEIVKYDFSGTSGADSPFDIQQNNPDVRMKDIPDIDEPRYTLPEEDREIKHRAALFKNTLRMALEKDPLKEIAIAIDTDIGAIWRPNIMALYKFFDELDRLIRTSGDPVFSRVRILRGKVSNGNLLKELNSLPETIKKEDIMILCRQANLYRRIFPEKRKTAFADYEGVSWITALDDIPEGPAENMPVYLPLLESVTLTLMAYADADFISIKNFYDSISGDPVTREKLETMIENREFVVSPKMEPVSIELIRDICARSREFYLSA